MHTLFKIKCLRFEWSCRVELLLHFNLQNNYSKVYTDYMTDTKLIQILIDSVASLRKDILDRFDKIDKKFENKFDLLDKKIDKLDIKLTTRIDKIGKQVAYLEDDAPTRDEHEKLVKRVERVEKKVALS